MVAVNFKGVNMSTDNSIMFKCQIDMLNEEMSNETFNDVTHFLIQYMSYGDDEEKSGINTSSDNIETVLQWLDMFVPDLLMAIQPLGKHASRNPFDFIYFAYVKYGLCFFLYPIVVLDVFWAGVKPGKLNTGALLEGRLVWERDTSGKLKSYFKMFSHDMWLTKIIVTWFISKSKYYKSWGNIFSIYHGVDGEITKLVVERES